MGIDSQNRVQLRLRASLEADVVLVAVADYLLHYLVYLVDLNGVYDEVLPCVLVLLGSTLETV